MSIIRNFVAKNTISKSESDGITYITLVWDGYLISASWDSMYENVYITSTDNEEVDYEELRIFIKELMLEK